MELWWFGANPTGERTDEVSFLSLPISCKTCISFAPPFMTYLEWNSMELKNIPKQKLGWRSGEQKE